MDPATSLNVPLIFTGLPRACCRPVEASLVGRVLVEFSAALVRQPAWSRSLLAPPHERAVVRLRLVARDSVGDALIEPVYVLARHGERARIVETVDEHRCGARNTSFRTHERSSARSVGP